MHLYLKILKNKAKKYENNLKSCTEAAVTWAAIPRVYSKKMEKIQERALKFIYNEYHSTYEELLAKSKLPSLKILSWKWSGSSFQVFEA
jgi:hypothetical protein